MAVTAIKVKPTVCRSVIAVVIATLLAGCTPIPFITFVNNTDQIVNIETFTAAGDLYVVKTKSGQRVKRKYIHVANSNDEIRIWSGRCAFLYKLIDDNLPFYRAHIVLSLQVEPDMRLHFRPDGSRPIPVSELANQQPRGYPLRPVSKTCR